MIKEGVFIFFVLVLFVGISFLEEDDEAVPPSGDSPASCWLESLLTTMWYDSTLVSIPSPSTR